MAAFDKNFTSLKTLSLFGIILSCGIIGSAYLISSTIKDVASTDTISVKGLAEKKIKADYATGFIRVSSKGATVIEAYKNLELEFSRMKEFLLDLGFEEKNLSYGVKKSHSVFNTINDQYGNRKQEFLYYSASIQIYIETKDVFQMKRLNENLFKLDERGVDYLSNGGEYLVSNLEEIKMSLIAEATENAYIRANEFAKSGKVKVGSMKSARQGAFYILSSEGGTDDSDYGGVYDKTTIDKVARVVVTINYGIRK